MSDLNVGNLSIDPNTNTVRMTSMSSGIDTEQLTQALYDAKKIPALRIESKIQVNDAKVAAYSDLRTLLGGMQTALDGLRRPPGLTGVEQNLFEQKAAYFSSDTTTSPASLLGVQATNRADVGSFDLRVEALASAHKAMSASFASETATLGAADAGTLTLGLGTGSTADIALTEDMTVYDIRDAINTETSTTNVKASVLKVADGDYRLILTGEETGVANSISVGGTAATTARLDLLNSGNKLGDAADAEIYVDEVQVFRADNTITDLMDGLTIDLYQAEPGTTVTVEIEANYTDAREAIAGFIDAYNGLRDFIDSQRQVSEAGEVDELAAPLFGDTLLRSLGQELGFAVGGAVEGLASGAPTTLAELGIAMGEDNRLSLDVGKLDEMLLADPNAVRKVFEFNAEASDPDLIVYGHSNALPASTFEVSKDAGTGFWTLSYGTSTIALEASGDTLKAPDGSAFDGLTLFWTGDSDPSGPITVTATQGIADRLYNAIDQAVDGLDGTIQQAIDEANAQSDGWREDVARIEARAEDYRLMLIEKFARLETALSLSESMLSQIRAQTDAMTADR